MNVTDTYAVNKHIPVYMNGIKVYGEEPPKTVPTATPTIDPNVTPDNNASIEVLYRCGIDGSLKNTIRPAINIKNTGTTPIDLSDIKVRYWFTNDGCLENSFICEYAVMGTDKVTGKFFNIDNPVPKADTYCEISFTKDAGKLGPGGSSGDIPFRIECTSAYDQTNDYSFDSTMEKAFGKNEKITAYVNGTLKFGIEPVEIKQTPPPGYKISGYIQPDFSIPAASSAKIKEGFKVELLTDGKYATTDKNGYFEIRGVTASNSHIIKISRENYLTREIKNIVVNSDVELGTVSSPIAIWAGDIAKNGVQDNAINISDIMEIASCFNSASGNAKYKEGVDLNKDEAVNITDIMIAVSHFNRATADYPAV
jgi:hypothetical protein